MAWLQPHSLSEALELLSRNPRIVCGGTDLFVNAQRNGIEAQSTDWLDIGRIEELKRILRTEEGLEIGAAVTAAEIWQGSRFACVPALQQAAKTVGGWQIQNRASLGGNVANASPAADMVVPLVAYRAEVRLASQAGSRSVPISEFIIGPKRTALREGEMIVSLFIPARSLDVPQVFLRHDQRSATDISIISVALLLSPKAGQIEWGTAAVGAAAPKPFVLGSEVEQGWSGELDAGRLQKLADLYAGASSPITDVRAGEEYRRSLVGTYIKRAANLLLDQISGSEKGEVV
ncbi:FAD binding domain-containing protein [Paenibacillus physcomitrellae]|uniref:Oxidoreductase n=1 Tax=Paenibacillus physcomitrellae TaxID=1619311 RepID=A0ABQ1FSK2_9BACL|nr:FAD binding domain-containing protein [Paenibacillus physcomitrellae]GGA26615.1 oxidoreductase [Paenibacillus physcomitrellae]